MTNLHEILSSLTVQDLQGLLLHIPGASARTRKPDLLADLERHLTGEGLKSVWQRLDETQRLAVAETLYSPAGTFDDERFEAKYGEAPEFMTTEGRWGRYHERPSLLGLFLYWHEGATRLPSDLAEELRAFVPRPAPLALATVRELPAILGEEPVQVRYCEREALLDLASVLRLVDQGKIRVSDKTALPGAATLSLLEGALSGDDFYTGHPDDDSWEQEIGPIKAFAWPLLLQAAGLVQSNGGKLALSPAGRKALASPAETLRNLWKKWQKTSLLDEFSRIHTIKGQKSKGRVMTVVAPRRAVIEASLQQCPEGEWIDVEVFSRYMVASGTTFDVTHDPWKLYICESGYGSLGYQGSHDWEIIQLRYLLCFLFEYAATLGVVDVAYTSPVDARSNYSQLWGTDDLVFLSRYDGLRYFRLTPLGAYCLGLREDYTAPVIRSNLRLSVLPSLAIKVAAGSPGPEESMLLETWAEPVAEQGWRLDRAKTLAAIEKGLDIGELKAFLEARDDQPLPETVEAFLKTSEKQGRALKVAGTARLFRCRDEETARAIAGHKETASLCHAIGKDLLAVRLEHEDKFKALVRGLGFGIVE